MTPKTHHEIQCDRLADEACGEIVLQLIGWRRQHADQMFQAALAAAVPAGAEHSPGEKAIMDNVRVKFARLVMDDKAFGEQARTAAQSVASKIMHGSKARDLFGLIEDIVNEKSSTQGDGYKRRAKAICDGFYPDGKKQ